MPDLRDIGEHGIIERLKKYCATADKMHYEDAAIIKIPDSEYYLVYSIDSLPVHLPQQNPHGINKFRVAGRFLAAHTLSDIVCCGAQLFGFAPNFILEENMDVTELDEFTEGIADILRKYDVQWETGDVKKGKPSCFVAFAWGLAKEIEVIRRCGARAGDLIVLTNRIGTGWAAYLARKFGVYNDLSSNSKDEIRQLETEPLLPYYPVRNCAIKGYISSGMDLTDGFADFLINIRNINNQGVKIYFQDDVLSMSAKEVASILNVNPLGFLFEGGYDTPMVHAYTISQRYIENCQDIFEKYKQPFIIIGEVVDNPNTFHVIVGKRKEEIPLIRDVQFENFEDKWVNIFIKKGGRE